MRTGRISDDQTRVSLLNGASSGSLPRGHFPHRHVKGRHAKVASFPRDFTPTACRPRFASGAGSIAETGEIRGMRARAQRSRKRKTDAFIYRVLSNSRILIELRRRRWIKVARRCVFLSVHRARVSSRQDRINYNGIATGRGGGGGGGGRERWSRLLGWVQRWDARCTDRRSRDTEDTAGCQPFLTRPRIKGLIGGCLVDSEIDSDSELDACRGRESRSVEETGVRTVVSRKKRAAAKVCIV